MRVYHHSFINNKKNFEIIDKILDNSSKGIIDNFYYKTLEIERSKDWYGHYTWEHYYEKGWDEK
jgi:hypothetical protein